MKKQKGGSSKENLTGAGHKRVNSDASSLQKMFQSKQKLMVSKFFDKSKDQKENLNIASQK